MTQLPNVLNPKTYALIENAMLFLASSTTCAIEIVVISEDVKFLHTGYLRGASKFLIIAINDGSKALGEGYNVSNWFGPNVIEIKDILKVNRIFQRF